MPDTNKHIDHSKYKQLAFVATKRFACRFCKFRKTLNYFPTRKDFHN